MALRLRGVPGLDVDAGLAFVGHNVEVFTHLLGRFVQLHEQDLEEIVKRTERADWVTVQQLAHSIKGGAATLGLTALAGLAQQLERAARDGGPHGRAAELANAMHAGYVALTRHLLKAGAGGPGGPPEP